MLSSFRNSLFWISDWFKGAKIRKHYDAVSKINADHGSEYSIGQRKKYLSEILQHCQETVPYYRNLNIKDNLLENYPVTHKNLIKASSTSFRSDKYTDNKTFKATTSGSTGTPFTVLHDIDKKRRHTADVRYFWESVGHAFGTQFYYLRTWNRQNKKSRLVQKRQNIVPIDVFKMDDTNIKALLDDIKASGTPKSILGYASALDRIAKYLDRHPTDDILNANVIAIIAMSESLDIPTKKSLNKHFDCPVVSRYANIECGMLAQQTANLNDFLVNMASYHIEILHLQKDIAVKEGEAGRIVVTDLFNKAMPLIRYDTGDIGVMAKSKQDGGTHYVFKKIEGRKMDTIYDTQSEPISSFTVTNNMSKYIELAQYQFIQLSKKEYKFKLNTHEKFQREDELLQEFKGYLGNDAKIIVEYVDEIPLLSSGKRKKVLNKCV